VERPAGLRELPWYLHHRVGSRAASEARRQMIRATHRHCRVEFRGPVHLGPGFSLDIPGRGTLIVGSGVEFRRGFVCQIQGDGRVEIGDGAVFTAGCLIQCSTSIEIGPGVVVGQAGLIVDGRHRFRDPERHLLAQGYDFKPIRIEEDAVIMGKCTVFANVGRRAVIGAHSVVSRDIPAYTLALGAPARPVEYFGPGVGPPGVPVTTGKDKVE
jgi:acetyltransferase-like isoleucine patch superfamily enzyme